MKKIFVYLFMYLCIQSCHAQKHIFNIKSYDIILLELNNNEVLISKKYTETLWSKKKIYLTTSRWRLLGGPYGSYYVLINSKKDTMNIKCYCGQEENLFFKNLPFKKGNYELTFKTPKEKIFGKKIKTAKEVQNVLFKDTYVSDKKPVYQDVYFKDIEFYEIDLKDTINVKLKRIE